MRVLLLSRSPSAFSTRRLSEVARSRGHQVRVVDPLSCDLLLDGRDDSRILYKDKPLGPVDLVLPRIGQSVAGYGLAVLSQLLLRGVRTLNAPDAIAHAHNKVRCLQALAAHGIDVPPTVMTGEPAHLERLARMVGGVPVIVRLLSSGGRPGVMICETLESMSAALETVLGLGHNFIVQPYLRGRGARDLRALVVGGRVIAAVRRRVKPGRFALSLSQGVKFAPTTLSARQARVAIESAKVVGLRVAAVDMIESEDKVRVFEVNASPALRAMEAATGLDLAAPIIDLGERIARGAPHRSSPLTLVGARSRG